MRMQQSASIVLLWLSLCGTDSILEVAAFGVAPRNRAVRTGVATGTTTPPRLHYLQSTRCFLTRDEYMRPRFDVPSTSTPSASRTAVKAATKSSSNDKDHRQEMIECAETGLCSVEEMNSMIQELEALNKSDTSDHVLKKALSLQVEMASKRERASSSRTETTSHDGQHRYEDHSFNHFVDYRSIGDYEAH